MVVQTYTLMMRQTYMKDTKNPLWHWSDYYDSYEDFMLSKTLKRDLAPSKGVIIGIILSALMWGLIYLGVVEIYRWFI